MIRSGERQAISYQPEAQVLKLRIFGLGTEKEAPPQL